MANEMRGERLEVAIESTSIQGDGVGRVKGMAVFVPGALEGEQVAAEVTRQKKQYAQTRLLEIRKPSLQRRTPPCKHFATCGGCALQFADYAHQLTIKQQHVRDTLARIGKQPEGSYEMPPIIGMESPWRYRNKAEYAIDLSSAAVGYYRKGSHAIQNIETCLLQPEVCDQIAKTVRQWLTRFQKNLRWEACPKHLVVRVSSSGQVLIALVTPGKKIQHQEALVEMILAHVPGVQGIVQNIQPVSFGPILGPENILLYGENRLEEELCGVRYATRVESFFQVNHQQAEKLYNQVLEFAAPSSEDTVIDAYCGAGALSLPLAQKAGKVLGIEVSASAVADARANAALNSVDNVAFVQARVEEALAEFKRTPAHAIVVDPPRRGLFDTVPEALCASQAGRIVYVSCDPATLGRDVARLSSAYKVERVQAVDMFPWTGHVECVVLMSKVKICNLEKMC